MKLSSRLERFNEPETLKMAKLGRELRGKGIDELTLALVNLILIHQSILRKLRKLQWMKTGATIRL